MVFNREKAIEQGDSVKIIKDGQNIDPLWGIDTTVITEKDIKALNEGKGLYFNDGEYAHVLVKG